MVDVIRPALFTIPYGVDLCETTVETLFATVGSDPLALSQMLILLPNNRAIKAMTEAFVRKTKTGLLLPRMAAVGDLSLDEALGPILDPLSEETVINSTIKPLQKMMMLCRLILKYRKSKHIPVSANEALRLARNLGTVIDEMEIEEIDVRQFSQIEPSDLSAHWNKAFDELLTILPQHYAELEQLKIASPATRRNQLLDQLNQNLRQYNNDFFVVAAGISTAAPAIARLLKTIAMRPRSMVILPCVDLDMSEPDWQALGPHEKEEGSLYQKQTHESHPQYHLKLLLNRMGFQRSEVVQLGQATPQIPSPIGQIFCIPDATKFWRDLAPDTKKMRNLKIVISEDSAQEARVIAIALRQAIENPKKRAALVTPDRELAVRVAVQLKRWNITVDDSAGIPLLETPAGSLIMALAQAIEDRFNPVSLLAIAKHPLVSGALERIDWLNQVRKLDVIWRGPAIGTGLPAMSHQLDQFLTNERTKNIFDPNELQIFWEQYSQILLILEKVADADLDQIFTAIISVATNLTSGAVWSGAAGRQLAQFFEELQAAGLKQLGAPGHEAIASIIKELFSGQMVRPPYGGHPRIAILGLLEARLQQSDILICAGLNEGSWPQLPQPDPWLAPRIRRELGLSGLDRNIGLSAHDLATAMGAREVILSRTTRDRSGPTVASRFLLRIQAFLGDKLAQNDQLLHYAKSIDDPIDEKRFDRPAPYPSLEQRQVKIHVTDFDSLKSDPFSFYARKIMRLPVMDMIDAPPGYAWRGSCVHEILEKWAKQDDCVPEKLIVRTKALLANSEFHPTLRFLWQPRIIQGLQWVANETARMRGEECRIVLASECKGEAVVAGIKITGRADRIDRLADGTLAVVDYKSGKPPSGKQVNAGFALQLGLIGLMAQNGSMKAVSGNVSAFEYWSLAKDKDKFGKIERPTDPTGKKNKLVTAEFIDFAKVQAEQILQEYIIKDDTPFTAKLHPEFPTYADYDQLMRLQEWDGREPVRDGGEQ